MEIQNIIEALKKIKRPLSIPEVCKKTGCDPVECKRLLDEAYHAGAVAPAKNGKYALPQLMGLVPCRARVRAGAPAFASPLDGSHDFYMDMPEDEAFDGDLVMVRETQGGVKRRGTLVYIANRAHTKLTGTLFLAPPEIEIKRHHKHSKRPHYVPEDRYLALISDRRFPAQIDVTGDPNGAENGELCVFEIVTWPHKARKMQVEVREHLGSEDNIASQLSALCALYSIEPEFDRDALNEAETFGKEIDLKDIDGRLDLRDKLIFTIDGADAQDFDDAVSLEEIDGKTVLGVHIADVSRYVTQGSALDAEARERGTSVYLPGRTIPMLPEALCNCLCSLQPNVDRLAYSCIMTLNGTAVTDYRIRTSVINSKARLTYDSVNMMLAGEKSDVPEKLHDTLKQMSALAQKLKADRTAHGALELELPEPDFKLDSEGFPVEMGVRGRGPAHELIEEFMLLANKTVAAHASRTLLPFAYRVHESPDSEKLMAMETTLEAMGHSVRLGSKPNQQKLQEVLEMYKNRPQSVIVSTLLLRAMSKARYSEKNLGHYGLAFKDYCHFTSPIRRYPDLLAHRMLKLQAESEISEERAVNLTALMHTLTSEASDCEEKAAQCERDGDKIMCAAYMSRHMTAEFKANVVRFTKKGALVMLKNSYEGLIPFKNMDDRYSTDDESVLIKGAKTHRIIRLGDVVTVTPAQTEIASGETEFYLLAEKRK